MRRIAIWLITGLLILSSAVAPTLAQSITLFSTETAAHRHCPADIIVWVNTPTGVYHFKGMRWYGTTTNGAYICRREADKAGYRATRNGQ